MLDKRIGGRVQGIFKITDGQEKKWLLDNSKEK